MKKIVIQNTIRIFLEGFGTIILEEIGNEWRMDFDGEMERLLLARPIKTGGKYFKYANEILKPVD